MPSVRERAPDAHIVPALHLPGQFEHEGFYFRFSTGLGGYNEVIKQSFDPIAARVSGIGGTIELGAGWTVEKGLVLGLAAYFERLLATDLMLTKSRKEPLPSRLEPSFRDTVLVGPLADWYPDPHTGMHFQASVGYFLLSRSQYTPGDYSGQGYTAQGGGGLVGFGQEWWATENSSIGITTQFSLAVANGKVPDAGRWTHWVVTTPTFVFTWTYQ